MNEAQKKNAEEIQVLKHHSSTSVTGVALSFLILSALLAIPVLSRTSSTFNKAVTVQQPSGNTVNLIKSDKEIHVGIGFLAVLALLSGGYHFARFYRIDKQIDATNNPAPKI